MTGGQQTMTQIWSQKIAADPVSNQKVDEYFEDLKHSYSFVYSDPEDECVHNRYYIYYYYYYYYDCFTHQHRCRYREESIEKKMIRS